MKAWKAVDQISIVALNPAIGLGPTNHKTISIEDGRSLNMEIEESLDGWVFVVPKAWGEIPGK